MVKSIANVLAAIPVGETQVLQLSIPQGRTYRILDIRVPFSVAAVALAIVSFDNDDRYIFMGTDAENTYTINEDIVGPKTMTARLTSAGGAAVSAGVVILYDDGEKT